MTNTLLFKLKFIFTTCVCVCVCVDTGVRCVCFSYVRFCLLVGIFIVIITSETSWREGRHYRALDVKQEVVRGVVRGNSVDKLTDETENIWSLDLKFWSECVRNSPILHWELRGAMRCLCWFWTSEVLIPPSEPQNVMSEIKWREEQSPPASFYWWTSHCNFAWKT